jgi:hypothetical protein
VNNRPDPADLPVSHVIVVKSEHMEDWYTIERAVHDNVRWEKRVKYGTSLMYSGRISDACVEGTAYEMTEIAAAIENGESVSFRRCAARFTKDGYMFSSPRNSQRPGFVSHAFAKKLAKDIRAKVVRPPVTEQ